MQILSRLKHGLPNTLVLGLALGGESGEELFAACEAGPFGFDAGAGLAACMEAVGEFAAAAEAYLESADSFRGSGNAAHYLLQAGRCYRLAGNDQAALAIYDRIAEEYLFWDNADWNRQIGLGQ